MNNHFIECPEMMKIGAQSSLVIDRFCISPLRCFRRRYYSDQSEQYQYSRTNFGSHSVTVDIPPDAQLGLTAFALAILLTFHNLARPPTCT